MLIVVGAREKGDGCVFWWGVGFAQVMQGLGGENARDRQNSWLMHHQSGKKQSCSSWSEASMGFLEATVSGFSH
jgi:hypothetical protein